MPIPSPSASDVRTGLTPSKTSILREIPELHQLQYIQAKGQTGTTEVHLINDVSHQWEEVALSLHFKDAAIRNISKDNPRDCKAACREMFAQWLRGRPGTRQPTTWLTLMDSISETDTELADRLSDAVVGQDK